MNPPARCRWQRAVVLATPIQCIDTSMGKLLAIAHTECLFPTTWPSCDRKEKMGPGCAPQLSPPHPRQGVKGVRFREPRLDLRPLTPSLSLRERVHGSLPRRAAGAT